MKSFNNKVAAITGAGSGIGQALAIALAKQGCNLALSDVNENGLANTVALLQAYPVKVTRQVVDVAKREEMASWAKSVVDQHQQVNLIFNNAGVAIGSTAEGVSYEDLEWLIGINFWGVVYGTKEFLPYLKQSGDGHIINISSMFGLTAQPTQSAYNASKFAVRGFTEALRQELDIEKLGVSATCVHPGGIRTNIAKTARINNSVTSLGMDPAKSQDAFDKILRTPAEEAAALILKAVQKNSRRLLIGADAKAVDILQRLMPQGYQKIFATATALQARFLK
ncbi:MULTISPECIES: SDR family NAD(P)-dependent oxidoreductase [unclassified Acinetobacter]|uniref:SDR family NAD(P)-dependent oxidoreductase n=1 Tax=unclassified Acinetobacter TaxID=196816 RepID=UPI0024494EEB|nr:MULTISPECIES: SDR family NAD(P)-dependent oxidoreductase [unclassified Acinetobacter]MDH0032932.1 SDR family NAD(P)-dependent oxidoreductase [Acinetobacter sp. GD04021]MDH0887500.1 SDR family NAD(P)-dependent oxidoreductase [Acinetobacter sp. GD03873]MDH1084723.1 SDR family NAD(P)-dependent oxidoreductase [Acinetobacter sp. GD03983]MDH2190886.1 SDR family NAD(P)-dependent oxidoreductase [Acinetobacter sp. GD03645]MDH2205050.1 SDR family NAD(P)-dependent oxidoreductase [Acinetobacter sp. GD0